MGLLVLYSHIHLPIRTDYTLHSTQEAENRYQLIGHQDIFKVWHNSLTAT